MADIDQKRRFLVSHKQLLMLKVNESMVFGLRYHECFNFLNITFKKRYNMKTENSTILPLYRKGVSVSHQLIHADILLLASTTFLMILV